MGIYLGNTSLGDIKSGAARLPSTYQEVEYIYSTSNDCRIDTGVTPTSNTLSQIKFMPLGVTGEVIFGMINGNDNADYRFFNYSSAIYRDLNSSRVYGSSCTANTLYEFEIGNNYIKNVGASSNLVSGSTVSGYTGSTTIKLNYNNQSGATSNQRWYYVKIRENGTLVRDFIPCYRKSDGVIGLRDAVNKVFYTNSGGGTFTKGSDVNKTSLSAVYLGSEKVWPESVSDVEFYYDFRYGSLAGFQAAGGDAIVCGRGSNTGYSYAFDSSGIYITATSNDVWLIGTYTLPDLTSASKVTVTMTGYFKSAEWSNTKGIAVGDNNSTERLHSSCSWRAFMSYNSFSPGYYNKAGLELYNNGTSDCKYAISGVAFSTGEVSITATFDLDTGECTYVVSGANNYNGTGTMSSSEISQFRSLTYAGFSFTRGYTDTGEKVHDLYIKVEY